MSATLFAASSRAMSSTSTPSPGPQLPMNKTFVFLLFKALPKLTLLISVGGAKARASPAISQVKVGACRCATHCREGSPPRSSSKASYAIVCPEKMPKMRRQNGDTLTAVRSHVARGARGRGASPIHRVIENIVMTKRGGEIQPL
jgi:hypothetical protein